VKRALSIILAAALAASGLSAEEPQIAFRLLDDYVQHRQDRLNRSMDSGGLASIICGVLLVGAASAVYFAGDGISQSISGAPMEAGYRNTLSLGLTVGGAALVVSGSVMVGTPARDLRSEYSDVFREDDPVIQEAMAAATLKSMADRAKSSRIGSIALWGTGFGLLAALKIGANIYEGNPWAVDLSGTVWSLAGIIPPLLNKKDEELLFDKYIAAREAIYSTTLPKAGEPKPRAKGSVFRIEVNKNKNGGGSLEIRTGSKAEADEPKPGEDAGKEPAPSTEDDDAGAADDGAPVDGPGEASAD
jgi:hypothetical protein